MATIAPQSKFHVMLPLPPSTNNLFATYRGRRVKSREYKAWLAATAPLLLELRRPKSLPAEITAIIFGKVNAARDLDNFLKPLCDSIVAAGVIPGDSLKYVTRLRISYGGDWDAEESAVMVSVQTAESA